MSPIKDAIFIFESVLKHCTGVLARTSPFSPEFEKIKRQCDALYLALACMKTKDPLPPVYYKGKHRCGVCGFPVDSDIAPGIKNDFCGHCGQRIDWQKNQ